MTRRRARVLGLLLAAALPALGAAPAAAAVYVQQGPKLAPEDLTQWSEFGTTLALSADGQTAVVGGPNFSDSSSLVANSAGAVWTLARGADGRWVEQGPPLTPVVADGVAGFGRAVALSADGSTLLIGGRLTNDAGGAVWAFTRTNGAWQQVGDPLVPSDAVSQSGFGESVAISADGKTALFGGAATGGGLAWVYVRRNGGWAQQGPALSPSPVGAGMYGTNVALSGDGGTALIDGGAGAPAWAFRRSNGSWAQDGPQLTADGSLQGSVALDATGTTAVLAGYTGDQPGTQVGAIFTYLRSRSGWTEAGPATAIPDGSPAGVSVALSPDATHALVGEPGDGLIGTAWLLDRAGGSWVEDTQLVPSDTLEADDARRPFVRFGTSVALTPDATTLLLGGFADGDEGAVWTFAPGAAPLDVPRLRASLGTTIPLGPIPASVVLDRGAAPTGTMTFRLYGPDENCVGRPAQTETVPVNGNGVYRAQSLTAGASGSYGVVVGYSGDARNAPLAVGCRDIAFQVLDLPQLTLDIRGSREVGAPLTIAPTLAGGTLPSGDVTISVYGPSDPLCAKPPVALQQSTAELGRIPAMTYVPGTTGRVTITVAYGGDFQNPPVSIGCGAATVTIGRATTAIAATASAPVAVGGAIGAAARVAGFHAGGAVTFLLFPPRDPTCTRRPVATVDAPLADGVAQSQAFATSTAGTYHLTATYAGDRYNGGIASACGAGAVTVAKARPALAVAASTAGAGTLEDRAQLRGAFRPGGNVRFLLFGTRDPRCRRRPVLTVLAPLDDSGRATTTLLGGAAPGRYEFVVRYGGDAANAATRTSCGANPVMVSHPVRRRRSRRRRAR